MVTRGAFFLAPGMLRSLVSGILNVSAHLLGKKTAAIPSMQIMVKIEPISGFRHGRFSDSSGGDSASTEVVTSPNMETLIANTKNALDRKLLGMCVS